VEWFTECNHCVPTNYSPTFNGAIKKPNGGLKWDDITDANTCCSGALLDDGSGKCACSGKNMPCRNDTSYGHVNYCCDGLSCHGYFGDYDNLDKIRYGLCR